MGMLCVSFLNEGEAWRSLPADRTAGPGGLAWCPPPPRSVTATASPEGNTAPCSACSETEGTPLPCALPPSLATDAGPRPLERGSPLAQPVEGAGLRARRKGGSTRLPPPPAAAAGTRRPPACEPRRVHGSRRLWLRAAGRGAGTTCHWSWSVVEAVRQAGRRPPNPCHFGAKIRGHHLNLRRGNAASSSIPGGLSADALLGGCALSGDGRGLRPRAWHAPLPLGFGPRCRVRAIRSGSATRRSRSRSWPGQCRSCVRRAAPLPPVPGVPAERRPSVTERAGCGGRGEGRSGHRRRRFSSRELM